MLCDLFEYVTEPQVVDDMQGSHRPGGVPPGRGEPVEAGDFFRADGAHGVCTDLYLAG